MKILTKAPDGGVNSGVTGYFLIEWKALFSIVLLKFNKGTREAFHSHAFNAWTIWLKGRVFEHYQDGKYRKYFETTDVKYTPRNVFHKIEALETTWALSFRGPWRNTWQENVNGHTITLTHGRKQVDESL